MARFNFGGTGEIVLHNSDGTLSVGSAASGTTGSAWTAKTGGTQITDLQNPDGTTLAGGVLTSPDGVLPQWLGPDGVATMWVSWGTGPRYLILSNDTGGTADPTARAAAATAQSTATAAQTTAASAQQAAGAAQAAAGSAQSTASSAAGAAAAATTAVTNLTTTTQGLDSRVSTLERGGGGTVSAAAVLFVRKNSDGTWPARPTSDGSVMVMWDGAPASDGSGPPTVTTGTGGMRPGDKWLSHP